MNIYPKVDKHWKEQQEKEEENEEEKRETKEVIASLEEVLPITGREESKENEDTTDDRDQDHD